MSCQLKGRYGVVCALVGIALAWCAPAAGQTYTWVNPAGGVFGDGGNWSPAGPPGLNDQAIFDLQKTYTATFDSDHTNDRLLMDRGDVTFDLDGCTYTLQHAWDGTPSVAIGDNSGVYTTARLTVSNGDLSSAELELGRWSENAGELIVAAGAHWTAFAKSFTVGVFGAGSVAIQDGGVCEYGNGFVAFQPDSTGVIDVTGLGSLWHVTGEYILAREGAGTMTVAHGATARTGRSEVAQLAGASGTVTVDGPGSRWELSATGEVSLYVGEAGKGSVTVQNGGAIDNADHLVIGSAAGGAGVLTVTGAGSRLDSGGVLNVGEVGTGRLVIEKGGTLVAQKDCHVGGSSAGGHVTVTGQGSTLSLPGWGGLFVGSVGVGTMTIAEGGSVTNAHSVIARNTATTGTVLVDGIGSTWASSGGLYVGGDIGGAGGTATLTVSNGGQVSVGGLLKIYGAGSARVRGGRIDALSAEIDASAVMTVEDGTLKTAGNLDNAGELELAGGGARVEVLGAMTNTGLVHGHGRIAGDLTNNAGGEIRAESGKRLVIDGINGPNAGQINLLGGTAEFAEALTNDADGNILGRGTFISAGLTNAGDVALSNGVTSVFGDVSNETSGRVVISGRSDVTFWDDVANNGALFQVSADSSATFFGEFSGMGISGAGHVYLEADITPGASPAAIDFGGDVTFGHLSRLNVELGGKTAGSEYDQVNVAGAAALDGTLAISLIGGFIPDPGDVFEVLNHGSRGGEFAATEGWGLPNNLALAKRYEPAGLKLIAAHYGDATLDGCVDGLDYIVWSNNYQQSGKWWEEGDFTGEGYVDGLDYIVWSNNYEQGCPGFPAGAVPEPASGLVLMLGVAALLRRRNS